MGGELCDNPGLGGGAGRSAGRDCCPHPHPPSRKTAADSIRDGFGSSRYGQDGSGNEEEATVCWGLPPVTDGAVLVPGPGVVRGTHPAGQVLTKGIPQSWHGPLVCISFKTTYK